MARHKDIELKAWYNHTSVYLDFVFQLSFEARPYNFSLAGLETIRDTGDGADVVSHGKEDQFLVDEIGV